MNLTNDQIKETLELFFGAIEIDEEQRAVYEDGEFFATLERVNTLPDLATLIHSNGYVKGNLAAKAKMRKALGL